MTRFSFSKRLYNNRDNRLVLYILFFTTGVHSDYQLAVKDNLIIYGVN